MNSTIRIILGAIVGVVVGMMVNGGIINLSGNIVPLPEGIDPNDLESLRENIHRFTAKNYVMPFLAHALGTLVGAFISAKIALIKKKSTGISVGIFFLLGGIWAANLLGTPLVPTAVDLIFAYLPMGWLGARLAGAK